MPEAQIIDRVLLHTTGAVREAVRLELGAAARELCLRYGVWVGNVEITMVPGQLTYPLTLAAGEEVAIIDIVHMGDAILKPVSAHGMGLDIPSSGFVYSRATGQITFGAIVDGATATVRVWKRPATAADIPEFLYDNYDTPLVYETVSLLMSHPDRPYTNPALSTLNHRRFLSSANAAMRQMKTGNTRADLPWSFPHPTTSRSLRR